jgi:cytochrome P450
MQFLLGSDGKEDVEIADNVMSRDDFLDNFNSGLMGTGLRIIMGKFRVLLPSSKYMKTCRRVHAWLEHFIRRQIDATSLASQQKSSMAANLGSQTDDVGYIAGHIVQSMLASKETTAVWISNAMWLLARHPNVYKRLREEVLRYPNREQLFTFDNLSSLTYLQNVMKESECIMSPGYERVTLTNTNSRPSVPSISRQRPHGPA